MTVNGAWARGLRRVAILGIDALSAVVALRAALLLRFDGDVPDHYAQWIPRAVLLLLVARLGCNEAASLDRWSFRLAGLADALRVLAAAVAGSVLFYVLCRRFVPSGLPRSVYILEFFLGTSLVAGARFAPRVLFRWAKLVATIGSAERTLIVGEDSAAELLARDLRRSRDTRHRLIGFVSGEPTNVGALIDGARFLGAVPDLPALIRRHRITTVLLASRCPSAQRVREIIETCGNCRVQFKIVPTSFAESERLAVSMLNDVSPDDLLPRDSVAFDGEAIRALVEGRRTLVTGAGGSIGSELCRQLARFGARQLVMVDINENELYLGARRLTAAYPDLEVRSEVADIRDPERIRALGERYRPEDVFHAAAHKHVPLMEEAPGEAIKNNIFGTLHVARMADLCAAERFVLISTDKAVKPTSVMGASKRIAELVVRDLGRGSRTRMTAVRFGNVLGSAGSVVPLFKEQIARGGPVTVTHPDCTRYFMTVSEAVGLTLLAGLGGYGELCVLDMGEPIRISDLARYMITLAGRAGEVEIVYTGLRPGEKLAEQLLTEDEERSEQVRNRIHVTSSPPPPPDLAEWLARLNRIATLGDRAATMSVLHVLVPTYQPSLNVVDGLGRGVVAGRAPSPEPRASAPGEELNETVVQRQSVEPSLRA